MNDVDTINATPPTARPPTTLPPASPSGEYLTRRQGTDFIREELGRPLSFSTTQKLAAQGEFAQPALYWGRRPLYTRESLRAWAEARSRRVTAPDALLPPSPPQPRRASHEC